MGDKKELHKYLVTADCLVISSYLKEIYLLLIKRDQPPYRGKWAIPGGFIDPSETAQETALRKLREETNFDTEHLDIEQMHTFSEIDRDPRGRVISIAFIVKVPFCDLIYSTGLRSQDAKVFSINKEGEFIIFKSNKEVLYEKDLAFDHATLIKYAISHLDVL